MTLQASGAISISQINSEFSRGNNLNSYRSTGWWTDAGSSGSFSGGAINMSDFYSKRVSAPGTPGNDAYTKLLLHFDGNLTDSSASNRSAASLYGSPACSASQSKFGGQSLYLNGTQAIRYASHTDFEPGSGPWTCDFWFMNIGTLAALRYLVSLPNVFEVAWGAQASGKLSLYAYDNLTNTYNMGPAATALSLNTWYHCAIVLETNLSLKLYINGVQSLYTPLSSSM